MSVSDVALLVIAVDLTALVVVGLIQAGRLSRVLETLERSSRRIESLADRVEGAVDSFAGVGEEAKHVVADVHTVTREAGAVAQALGVARRTRAAMVGARAAVDVMRRHSENGKQ